MTRVENHITNSGAAMKLFMKKINSLLLLLIVTALFLSGCSGTALFAKPGLKPMRFSQFSILGGSGNTSTFSDENEIAYYVEAINSAEVMKQDISNGSLAEYRVLLEGKKPKHTREFTLYLDENLENRNLFIRLDKELRKRNLRGTIALICANQDSSGMLMLKE